MKRYYKFNNTNNINELIIKNSNVNKIKGINEIKEITYIKGMKGLKGIKGLLGNIGDKGYIGTDGLKGTKGYIGCKGYIGLTGLLGNIGDKGIAGEKGNKGEKGYIGKRGVSHGKIGITGDKGDKGNKSDILINLNGEKGNIGKKGEKGEKGGILKGLIGEKGEIGELGSMYPAQEVIQLNYGEYIVNSNIEFNNPKVFGIISAPGFKRYLKYNKNWTKIDELTKINGMQKPLNAFLRNNLIDNKKYFNSTIWNKFVPGIKISFSSRINRNNYLGILDSLSFNAFQKNNKTIMSNSNNIVDSNGLLKDIYVRILIIDNKKENSDYSLKNCIKKMSNWIKISKLVDKIDLKNISFYNLTDIDSILFRDKCYFKCDNNLLHPNEVYPSVTLDDSVSVIYKFSNSKFVKKKLNNKNYVFEDWELYKSNNINNGYIYNKNNKFNLNISGEDNIKLIFKSINFSICVKFYSNYLL